MEITDREARRGIESSDKERLLLDGGSGRWIDLRDGVLWRGLKTTVAANRCYASLEELTDRAVTWLDDMTPAERLRSCGFEASKFDWLPT